MRMQELDVAEATNKWWAGQQARQRNLNNKSRYDSTTQRRVEAMKMALSVVYAAREIYERYGKQGVSIKVDQPRIRDRDILRSLEQHWDDQGVIKRVTPQGIIYRFVR